MICQWKTSPINGLSSQMKLIWGVQWVAELGNTNWNLSLVPAPDSRDGLHRGLAKVQAQDLINCMFSEWSAPRGEFEVEAGGEGKGSRKRGWTGMVVPHGRRKNTAGRAVNIGASWLQGM